MLTCIAKHMFNSCCFSINPSSYLEISCFNMNTYLEISVFSMLAIYDYIEKCITNDISFNKTKERTFIRALNKAKHTKSLTSTLNIFKENN